MSNKKPQPASEQQPPALTVGGEAMQFSLDVVPRALFDAVCARFASVIGEQAARLTNLEAMLRIRQAGARQDKESLQFSGGGIGPGAYDLVHEQVRDKLLAAIPEAE